CRDNDADGVFVNCNTYSLPQGPDCDDNKPQVQYACATCLDLDEDGFFSGCDSDYLLPQDCDDNNPNVATRCGECLDSDGDGFFLGCDAYVTVDPDCDDTTVLAAPGLAEVCDDLDNDCNGQIDDGLSFDADGDGFQSSQSCALSGRRPDCDDTNPNV